MIQQIIKQLKLGLQLSPLLSVLNVFFVFLSSLSILIGQITIKNVYAAVQPGGTSTEALIVWLVVFFINMSIFGSPDNMQNMIIEATLKKMRILLHKLFMYKSYRLEQDSLYDSKKLDTYEYIRGNLDAISEVPTIMLNRFLACFFTLIFISFSIVAIDVLVVIAVIVSAISVSMLNKYIAVKKVALNMGHVTDERHADYYKRLLTAREHAKEIHLSPNKSWLIEKWKYHIDKALLPKGRFERSSIVLGDTVRFFEDCFPYLFAMYFIYRVSTKSISQEDAIYMVGLVGALKWSVKELVNILTLELFEQAHNVSHFENFLGMKTEACAKEVLNDKPADNGLPYGDFVSLHVENVSYRYPNGESDAVRNISLTIKKGQIISILGYNGSGKTTLAKILCGTLKEYRGKVTINGHDISGCNHEDYFRYFGVVFQDFTRYKTSLRNNVGFGNIERIAESAAVKVAAQKAGLNGVIEKIDKGLEAMLGKDLYENGNDLSGGEWQRVALARAYMGEPEILLLDEPTASIDPIEEQNMLDHLKSTLNGKTAILISHRIGFARLADLVYMMDGGAIVESGSHEELVNLRGIYSRFFLAQRNLFREGEQ
jgi:ABC-type bacteriocin/lantibiotic exporter with double-glycine peptidase domain